VLQQLATGLIEANHRLVRVVGAPIDFQHIFHAPDKLDVGLGRDAPLYAAATVLVRFFERAAYRLARDALDLLELHQPIGQQLQRPAVPPVGRMRTG
jgi:hypothetical protein